MNIFLHTCITKRVNISWTYFFKSLFFYFSLNILANSSFQLLSEVTLKAYNFVLNKYNLNLKMTEFGLLGRETAETVNVQKFRYLRSVILHDRNLIEPLE